jgi:hypothetical protein
MAGCPHPARGATGNCGVCGYPIPQDDKEALRERFRKVIKLAGYSDAAAEKILGEYFERYYAGDRAQFIEMMEEYEENYRTRAAR